MLVSCFHVKMELPAHEKKAEARLLSFPDSLLGGFGDHPLSEPRMGMAWRRIGSGCAVQRRWETQPCGGELG
jgi:hypothetical protein